MDAVYTALLKKILAARFKKSLEILLAEDLLASCFIELSRYI